MKVIKKVSLLAFFQPAPDTEIVLATDRAASHNNIFENHRQCVNEHYYLSEISS
jgi:hypothetical protein